MPLELPPKVSYLTMAAVTPQASTLQSLKDKVVVITGSARGIGFETVKLLHEHGAVVVHGDWDAAGGKNVDAQLLQDAHPAATQFVQTDVTDYDSVLNLFETAWKAHGKVDIAISNAGLQESGNWFDPGLDRESIKTVYLLPSHHFVTSSQTPETLHQNPRRQPPRHPLLFAHRGRLPRATLSNPPNKISPFSSSPPPPASKKPLASSSTRPPNMGSSGCYAPCARISRKRTISASTPSVRG